MLDHDQIDGVQCVKYVEVEDEATTGRGKKTCDECPRRTPKP